MLTKLHIVCRVAVSNELKLVEAQQEYSFVIGHWWSFELEERPHWVDKPSGVVGWFLVGELLGWRSAFRRRRRLSCGDHIIDSENHRRHFHC